MDLREFQDLNAARGRRWHQGDLSQWSLLEWTGAMCGEAGEAANAAKKLRRIDLTLPNKDAGLAMNDVEVLRQKVATECADTIIYALLIMSTLGIDAAMTIAQVFNLKSYEYGFPEVIHVGMPTGLDADRIANIRRVMEEAEELAPHMGAVSGRLISSLVVACRDLIAARGA